MRNPLAPKFKDTEIVVAITSGFSQHFPQMVRRGDRLRGGHIAVQKHPEWFVPDGTPMNEWPDPMDRAVDVEVAADVARKEEQATRRDAGIATEDQVVAIAGFRVNNILVREGDILDRRNPLVTDPETRKYFATPARPLASE